MPDLLVNQPQTLLQAQVISTELRCYASVSQTAEAQAHQQ